MPFEHLMQDRVTLIKKDGLKFEGIKASVQRDKIFSNDVNIPIEEGDVFERTLPSGVVERYTILDAGFNEGIGGIKSHYQSEVQKQTKIDPPQQPSQVVYNLTGPNARINIQSVDSSSNIVGIDPTNLFSELRDTIQKSVFDIQQRAELTNKVKELEESQDTKNFTMRYQEFMALAASHITVLAPFLPALSQMLP